MNRYYYRVTSGTMHALVWANGYRQAIRRARAFRNWRTLSTLTKFQYRTRNGEWGTTFYVKTAIKP